MKITLYEPWMKNQIIDLFVAQYGVEFDDFEKLFVRFYEGDYQVDKSIRIVALDEKIVAGFQSFFYWPYEKSGVSYNSYQSGNSLVHPDYRGKGIFRQLLNYLEEIKIELDIDFLVGFPVEASKNSFLRNGWGNILDLQWYVKFVSIKSLFINRKPLDIGKKPCFGINHSDRMKLSRTEEFNAWRQTYTPTEDYFNFTYKDEENQVVLECKLQRRKKVLKEVIIGNIHSTTESEALIEDALKDLKKNLKKLSLATFISIALVNNPQSYVYKAILNQKFKLTKKRIYFIVKSFKSEIDVENAKKWELFRSDIDTW